MWTTFLYYYEEQNFRIAWRLKYISLCPRIRAAKKDCYEAKWLHSKKETGKRKRKNKRKNKRKKKEKIGKRRKE